MKNELQSLLKGRLLQRMTKLLATMKGIISKGFIHFTSFYCVFFRQHKRSFLLVLFPLNGLFTLDNTKNTETETDNDNYGFHCSIQSTSHCTETLPLISLATYSHFIGLATYIILGVAQCEHTISITLMTLTYCLFVFVLKRFVWASYAWFLEVKMLLIQQLLPSLHRLSVVVSDHLFPEGK